LKNRNVDGSKDFDNDSTEELVIRKKRRSFRSVFAFVGGLAFGVILSMAFQKWSSFSGKEFSTEAAAAVAANIEVGLEDWMAPQPEAQAPPRSGLYTTKTYPTGEVIEGTQCGDSWQAAKAYGCIYDPLASRWYSPECFIKESFDDMLLENNFTLYSDKEHTIQVPFEVAQRGEVETLYPNFDVDYIHCIYLWRKMQHALANDLLLDDDLWEEGHTFYCTNKLLKWADPNVQGVASVVGGGKPFCGRHPQGVSP